MHVHARARSTDTTEYRTQM